MNQSEISEKATKKAASISATPKSILEAFEYIVDLAENSNLSDEFFETAKLYIKYASRKLKLTPMQITLLAMFVDRSEDNRIYISEIAKYAGCRTTRILRLANDIDVLESKHYLRASRSNKSVSYRVPFETLTALRKNQPYQYQPTVVKDINAFFDSFLSLMKEKNADELTHSDLIERTNELLAQISHTQFVTRLKGFHLCNDDTLLLIYMSHLYVENQDDNILFSDLDNVYDNDELPSWIKTEFRNRSSELFKLGLIENVNEDGIARSDAFKLTDMAKYEFLAELNLTRIGNSEKGLIKADTLTEKKLFYNKTEEEQITRLASILAEDKFNEVQMRLQAAGMRSGFCCLFYGSPGTGKTETVYQIARLTGRDIMQVDIDKIKSCWVGESEKNIKALFTRYSNICKNSKLKPILLFNEADAVLGVRMEGASRAVDKMENSIQNIILQEMENLDGIMIATTNLTTNLDKAFERRFLYKILFNRPSLESRSKIWQTMLEGLPKQDADTLATQFDLSGGEIENIARKHTVNAILSGSDRFDIAEIIDTCRHERIHTTSSATRIGF